MNSKRISKCSFSAIPSQPNFAAKGARWCKNRLQNLENLSSTSSSWWREILKIHSLGVMEWHPHPLPPQLASRQRRHCCRCVDLAGFESDPEEEQAGAGNKQEASDGSGSHESHRTAEHSAGYSTAGRIRVTSVTLDSEDG